MGKMLPGGQVVRRLVLAQKIVGPNPTRAAKKKDRIIPVFFLGLRADSDLWAGSRFRRSPESGAQRNPTRAAIQKDRRKLASLFGYCLAITHKPSKYCL